MSSSTFLVRLYCATAALFFAACAFAQSNDPDPEFWIAGYLTGGCILNIFVVKATRRHSSSPTSNVHTSALVQVTRLFAAVTAAFVTWWLSTLLPKLDYALLTSGKVREFAWSCLEFEEGREIGGQLLLLGHVLQLSSLLSTHAKRTLSVENEQSSAKRNLLGTLFVLSMIGGAVYLWINFQSSMNQKENMQHCNGVFGGVVQEDLASLDELPALSQDAISNTPTDEL